MNKDINYFSNKFKKVFLIDIAKTIYSQGDEYYAWRSKNDVWHYGYNNDYPLQHGKGKEWLISDVELNVIIDGAKRKKLCKLHKEIKAQNE